METSLARDAMGGRDVLKRHHRTGWVIATAALMGLLAGCSAAAAPGGSNPSTPSSAGAVSRGPGSSGGHAALSCARPCVEFAVQISFTGADPLQGSFIDNTSGTGYSSCAEFASGDSVGFVQGPGTPTQTDTQINGKSLSFALDVGHDRFHGPGTYAGSMLIGGGVTIGSDTFFGTDSTETINADGSGQASFTNLTGAPSQPESGTITWSCSG